MLCLTLWSYFVYVCINVKNVNFALVGMCVKHLYKLGKISIFDILILYKRTYTYNSLDIVVQSTHSHAVSNFDANRMKFHLPIYDIFFRKYNNSNKEKCILDADIYIKQPLFKVRLFYYAKRIDKWAISHVS